MTYEEALEYVYSRRKFQKSNSLERIERLLELLGNPHQSLKFIHVVGTNGKGSVSMAINEILMKSGYTVGLFTSPFVVEFGERIRVNDEYMPKNKIAFWTDIIREKLELMEKEELYPTVFEVTTALGMVYFREKGCDYVVLEAGIGGEHDSTNVIPPAEVCVFTHISLDHSEMLGDTPEKIAVEKSGIIKKGSSVVSFPEENSGIDFIPQKKSVTEIIEEKAETVGAEFLRYSFRETQIIHSDIFGSEFLCFGKKYKTRLCGAHQVGNMFTAISAALALKERGVNIPEEAISRGIAAAVMPARMETVSEKPLIILDGGHNEGCMKALSFMIEKQLSDKKIILLMALMKDKEADKVVEIIAPRCDKIYMTKVDPIRGEGPAMLKEKAKPYCSEVYAEENALEAFVKIREDLTGEDALIVAGSFYLASDIRNKFFS